MIKSEDEKVALATFGGGCFWCTEAVFNRIEGVRSVMPGYSGGSTVNPTYEEVCSGKSGHAEVVQIEYDPAKISYEQLLEVFWKAHDPTTLNRQGADVGTQYRSIILYRSKAEKEIAEKSKHKIETSGAFKDPVVTELKPFETFYSAEDYHQEYYEKNRGAYYCSIVIGPKLKKLGLE
jgi:peptide-methionine (S)-S-oxide reductase